MARLTIVADPDGLLLEEGILEGIRQRGFDLIPFDDHIAFRYAYESKFRSRWDRGEQTDLVVVLRSSHSDLSALPFDLLQAGRRLSFSLGEIFPHLSYPVVAALDRAEKDGLGVLSGLWSCFFHIAADFFGMDNYFVKMYTDPEVVDAVTERIVQFYLDANEIWLGQVADRIDAIFFGNDFGSQQDLLVSPALFERFVMPYFVRFTEQAKRFGLKVVLHSCGAINRAIPYLIDAGVDALHPIQALARDMDAEGLARRYNGKIVFIGGVDTQRLLPFGTPQQVRDEVHRLRDLFGPNYIVSPSHEALLPNVSAQNLEAMAEAALD